MPVFVDQNGNLYFAAAALQAADQALQTPRAALVTALTAITPQKRQVRAENDGTIILSAAVEIPDSAYASAPSTGNRKILTALHPNGDMLANDSFVVPDGIYQMWTDFASAGCGGGGGDPTPGGGGGGGCSGGLGYKVPFATIPGETINVAIGAAGAAGAVGAAGGSGGATTISSATRGIIFQINNGIGGSPGANPNGGSGAAGWIGNVSGGVGGAGTGPSVTGSPNRGVVLVSGSITTSGGGAGGALNFSGGSALAVFGSSATGGTGGVSGGGGGGGGCSIFGTTGRGGSGGSNGTAGTIPVDTTAWGAGGGGGSGNAAGGAGLQGFARFFY